MTPAQPDLFGATPPSKPGEAKTRPSPKNALKIDQINDAISECQGFLLTCAQLSRHAGFLVMPRDLLMQAAASRSPAHIAAMTAIISDNIATDDGRHVAFTEFETQ